MNITTNDAESGHLTYVLATVQLVMLGGEIQRLFPDHNTCVDVEITTLSEDAHKVDLIFPNKNVAMMFKLAWTGGVE